MTAGRNDVHALKEKERQRYSRQMLLPGVGEAGQQKLLAAKVLIVGAGGLGSPAAMYLAAAGIGELGIVDDDAVDLSNLQRQIIHQTADIGKKKADSAKETLTALNPDAKIIVYRERIARENIADIIRDRDYDFILDCTDNFPAKFLINDACVFLRKPFSHAGVVGFVGQTMTVLPGEGPCYRCVFEEAPSDGAVPTSREVGILGAVSGILGVLQATEAIKYSLGLGELLVGTLLTYDALSMQFRRISLPQSNKSCTACGENRAFMI